MPEVDLSRRGLLQAGLGLSAAMVLGGTANFAPGVTQRVLMKVSSWIDRVQSGLFDIDRMAQTYHADTITSPFPFNCLYPESLAPHIDPATWRLKITGRVQRAGALTLTKIYSQLVASRISCIIRCQRGLTKITTSDGISLSEPSRFVIGTFSLSNRIKVD